MKKTTTIIMTLAFTSLVLISGCQEGGQEGTQQRDQSPASGSAPTETTPPTDK